MDLQRGETALHKACKEGRIQVANFLVDHHSNISAADHVRITASPTNARMKVRD